MQLPNNEVGISDILAYRACPQEFAFGMRRHVPLPERFALFPGERDEPPEAESYATAYGHAVHDAVQMIEETDCADEVAIQTVWTRYTHWLEPDDLERMRTDLATWHSRRVTGFRLVGAELEFRVPLFKTDDGTQIYFRGRIDVLYQHLQNPGYFYSRDYKSSRFPKSEEEVHKDIQQWSYNFAVHEMFPECQTLIQGYDQFRFGLIPTRKNDQQRAQMRDWLILNVKAILADEVLAPSRNDMCHFCPLMMDCRETHRSADYWINRLGALAPVKKSGRKLVMELQPDHFGYETYIDMLPKVKEALKVMELYVKTVEGDLKEMPEDRRAELGYELGKGRRLDTYDADAKRAIHQLIGDDFMHIVTVSKTQVEEFFGKDSETAKRILDFATKKESAPPVKPRRAAA